MEGEYDIEDDIEREKEALWKESEPVESEEFQCLFDEKDAEGLSTLFDTSARVGEIIINGHDCALRNMIQVTIKSIKLTDMPNLSRSAISFVKRLINRGVLIDMFVEEGLAILCFGLITQGRYVGECVQILSRIVQDATYSRTIATSIHPMEVLNVCTQDISDADRTCLFALIGILFYHELEVYDAGHVVQCVTEMIRIPKNSRQLSYTMQILAKVSDKQDVAGLMAESEEIINVLNVTLAETNNRDLQSDILTTLGKLMYYTESLFPINIPRVVQLANVGQDEQIVVRALTVLQNYCQNADRIAEVWSCGGFDVLADKINHGTFTTKVPSAAILANMVLSSNQDGFSHFMSAGIFSLLFQCLLIQNDGRSLLLEAVIRLCEMAATLGCLEQCRAEIEQAGIDEVMTELGRDVEDEKLQSLIMRLATIRSQWNSCGLFAC